MTNIRQLRDKVRRDLHQLAKVPAFYISPFTKLPPRFVEVRLHDNVRGKVGQLATSREYAKNVDVRPSIVVMRDQLPFIRSNSIFSFSHGEAYKVESVEPPDGITLKAFVSALSRSKAEEYPYPLPEENTNLPIDTQVPIGYAEGGTLYFPILTPVSSFEVVHNLGRIPNITILDDNEREISGDIRYIDKNKFMVTIDPPMIGEVVVN